MALRFSQSTTAAVPYSVVSTLYWCGVSSHADISVLSQNGVDELRGILHGLVGDNVQRTCCPCRTAERWYRTRTRLLSASPFEPLVTLDIWLNIECYDSDAEYRLSAYMTAIADWDPGVGESTSYT